MNELTNIQIIGFSPDGYSPIAKAANGVRTAIKKIMPSAESKPKARPKVVIQKIEPPKPISKSKPKIKGGNKKMTIEQTLLKHPRLVGILTKAIEVESLTKKAENARKQARRAYQRIDAQNRRPIIKAGASGLDNLITTDELQAHIAAISEALPDEADWLTDLLNQIEEMLTAGQPARSDEEMAIEEKIQKATAAGKSYTDALLSLDHSEQRVLLNLRQ